MVRCRMSGVPRFLVATLAVWPLALPGPARAAAASIRSDRMLELDGEPFFPIGLLDLGTGDYDDWNARIRQSGANVVWEYETAYRDESPSCRAVVDSARAGGYKLLLGSYDTLWWDDPATPEHEVEDDRESD